MKIMVLFPRQAADFLWSMGLAMVLVLAMITMVYAGSEKEKKMKILSLNPYSALLECGQGACAQDGTDVFFEVSQNKGAISLGNLVNSPPTFAMGFTVPDDYSSGSPLFLVLLMHSQLTIANCEWFQISAGSIFRMRTGEPSDAGPLAEAITAVDASTSFLIGFPEEMVVSPPLNANETFRVRFAIHGGGLLDSFPDLEPGDGVVFSIFRNNTDFTPSGSHPIPNDNCDTRLIVGGISIQYE